MSLNQLITSVIANSMSNTITKIDTRFDDDIEVFHVIDIDTLRTIYGHRSTSSLSCGLYNKLAGHYRFYENDKNKWPLILFCINCANHWIICKICMQCKPILSKKSLQSHSKRKYFCPDASFE